MPATPDKLTATLLRLWDAGPRGLGGGACSPAILKELRAHGCLIAESPSGGAGGGRLELERVGLGSYRELIEALAARHHWSLAAKALIYQRTTSTNDVCLRHAAHASTDNREGGIVAIADAQSRGRGRRGNAWAARPGQSVLMSLLLYNVPSLNIDRLTLLAGLAAAEALESILQDSAGGQTIVPARSGGVGGVGGGNRWATGGQPVGKGEARGPVGGGSGGGRNVQIKWPNDLILPAPHGAKPRKLAGILIERRGPHAVLGIGVNVHQGPTDFPPEIRPKATSIYMQTAQQIDRLRIIAALLKAFNSRLSSTPDNDSWITDWKARCPMLGQPIHAREITPHPKKNAPNSREITGLVQDIDPLQGLLIRDSTGALRWLTAQTTTLSP